MQLINALQNNVLLRSIILEAWLKFEPTGRGWEDERSTYNLKINYLLKRERERREQNKCSNIGKYKVSNPTTTLNRSKKKILITSFELVGRWI